MDTKAQDALVIIELYKLRCEPLMRTARAWFVSEFTPQSGRQIVELMLSGQEESAYYRMVASYWETTASLVNNGGVDETVVPRSEHGTPGRVCEAATLHRRNQADHR